MYIYYAYCVCVLNHVLNGEGAFKSAPPKYVYKHKNMSCCVFVSGITLYSCYMRPLVKQKSFEGFESSGQRRANRRGQTNYRIHVGHSLEFWLTKGILKGTQFARKTPDQNHPKTNWLEEGSRRTAQCSSAQKLWK